MAELVDCGVATQNRTIAHMYMTGDGRIVGHDDVVTNHAVVGDMDIRHQQIVAANTGDALVLHGSAMQGTAFADDVVVTNHQPGRLTLVLLVLTLLAHRRELEYPVPAPDGRRPLDNNMGGYLRAGANLDVGTI